MDLSDFDLVLTSYETLAARDVEVGRVSWQVLVCDEAQKIKNPSTRAAHAVKAMKADVRIAMTGTPVENSLDDLWSLIDFFGPGLLGSLKEFRERYSGRKVDPDQAAEELQLKLGPVVLRRLKEDLLDDLPPLLPEQNHIVELSEVQAVLYRRLQHAAAQGEASARLAAIQRLLQICAHPSLVSKGPSPDLDPVASCPKLQALLEALSEVERRGERALVFARWVGLQWLLADAIQERFSVSVDVLNGSVPAHHRQAAVDRFSDARGFGAMVLSARACGVGLNITAANHVFHYTREWNPAVEAQATDRVHRIGQKKPVAVHFFEATIGGQPTADAALGRILGRKRGLIRDFIQPMADRRVRLSDFDGEVLGPPAGQHAPLASSIADLLDPLEALARLGGRSLAVVREQPTFLQGGAGVLVPLDEGWAAVVDRPDRALDALRGQSGSGVLYLRSSPGFLLRRKLASLGSLVPMDEVLRRLTGSELLPPEDPEVPLEEADPVSAGDGLEGSLPPWLETVADAGQQRALLHLEEFGHMTELEARRIMGNSRATRRFARQLDHYSEFLPFRIRVEVGPSGKTWTRE